MKDEKNREVGIGWFLGLVLVFLGTFSMFVFSLLLGVLALIFGSVLFYTEYTHRKANVPASSEKT